MRQSVFRRRERNQKVIRTPWRGKKRGGRAWPGDEGRSGSLARIPRAKMHPPICAYTALRASVSIGTRARTAAVTGPACFRILNSNASQQYGPGWGYRGERTRSWRSFELQRDAGWMRRAGHLTDSYTRFHTRAPVHMCVRYACES